MNLEILFGKLKVYCKNSSKGYFAPSKAPGEEPKTMNS
jgi:hypothetical protein